MQNKITDLLRTYKYYDKRSDLFYSLTDNEVNALSIALKKQTSEIVLSIAEQVVRKRLQQV